MLHNKKKTNNNTNLFRLFFTVSLVFSFWCLPANAQLGSTPESKVFGLQGPICSISESHLHKKNYYTEDEYQTYKKADIPLPLYDTIPAFKTIYDRYGFVVEKHDYSFNTVTTKKYLDQANHPGLVTESITFRNGITGRVYTFEFDSDFFPYKAKAVDGNGKLIFTEDYSCSLEGDSIFITCNHLSVSGNNDTSSSVLRADDRTLAKVTTENSNRMEIIHLDRNGQVQRIISHNKSINSYEKKECYRSMGLIVDYTLKNGIWCFISKGETDEYGNITKQINYNSDGSVLDIAIISLDYDSYGNWIRKEVYIVDSNGNRKDSSESNIIVRNIEYYQ